MEQIRVYIIAAYPAIIEGLKTFLKSLEFISFHGYSDNFENAKLFLADNSPDILIIDDSCFNKSSFSEFLDFFPASIFKIGTIIFTGSNDPTYLRQLVTRGINSVLHKTANEGKIIEAVKLVSIGNVYYDNMVISTILNGKDIIETIRQLSKREREIMKLISNGLKNKDVADKLFISRRTVETNKAHIIKKLNIKSSAELTIFSVSNKDEIDFLSELT